MFIAKSKIATAIALAALTCVASTALARTAPARVGGPYEGSDTCFKDYDKGMRNECGAARWYDIGLQFETGGFKTVEVYGSSMSSCYYVEVTNSGVMTYVLMTPVSAGFHTASVTLGAGNFGKVQCNMPNNAYLYGVNYTP